MTPPPPFRTRLRRLLAVVGTAYFAAFSPMASAQEPLEAPFTRITTGEIATIREQSNVAAWGDYDGDGWLDLFIGNNGFDESNALFRNNRDGTFQKISTTPISQDPAEQSHGAAWVDYDNDGALDLFVATLPSVPNRLYRGHGDGRFTRVTEADVGSLASDVANSVGASWADFDRDGNLDLFVPNGALIVRQQDFLYRNLGNGRFSRVLDSPIATAEFSSTQGTWADYDNDGDPDLFVTHSQDQGNSLFRNDGDLGFVEVTAAAGIATRGDSVGSAWGDYDNDGDLDLYVTNLRLNQPSTRNFFYRNNGNGTFERVTTGPLVTDTGHFLSPTWVDYDNDGFLDLFVSVDSVNSPIKNRLYRNQGDGTFVRATTGSLVTTDANAGGAAWGDYDNDGFPDVMVAYGTIYSDQPNGLHRNNGNTNGWLKLRCVGTTSNRSALGTKVRVRTTVAGRESWQLRQIVGSEGWLSFQSLDLIFGLGNAGVADIVRIEWPSGLVQEFRDVAARQTLLVVEGDDHVSPGNYVVTSTQDAGPGSLRQALLDANATPSTDTIAFRMPGSGPHLISLQSALPDVTSPVVIDGTTQPGFAGKPLIEINGGTTPLPIPAGLRILSGGSIVRSLAFVGTGPANSAGWSADLVLETGGTNVVEGCFFGLHPSGEPAAETSGGPTGVLLLGSSDNRIGGNGPTSRNFFTAPAAGALVVQGTSRGNQIVGNHIGVNPSGTAALPGASTGIILNGAEDSVVGGIDPEDRNVIVAPLGGIQLTGTRGTLVRGNVIGADASGSPVPGTVAAGSQRGAGILVEGPGSRAHRIESNLILGMGRTGSSTSGNEPRALGAIHLVDSSQSVIVGNHLGAGPEDTSIVGNAGPGIAISGGSEDITIGGSTFADANLITGSRMAAITVFGSNGNSPQRIQILRNRILANEGQAIDLVAPASGAVATDGPTPNDSGDADLGPNGLQNHPVITLAQQGPRGLTVVVALQSRPLSEFRFLFYQAPSCDASGHAPAFDYLSQDVARSDASGNATLTTQVPYNARLGDVILAMVVDPDGNASEFSPCRAVTTDPSPDPTTIPFRALFAVTNLVFPNPGSPSRLEVRVGGSGPASDLGLCSVITTNQFAETTTGLSQGDFTLTTETGDQVTFELTASTVPDPANPLRLTFNGTGHMRSGTGRLSGLQGEAKTSGWSELKNPSTGEGIGHLEIRGELPVSFASYRVTTTNDAGPGSLRQAIQDANASPGLETIAFDIPGFPPHVIQPRTGLPTVTDPIHIDGTTQPGFDGRPLVEITAGEVLSGDGLVLAAGNSWIRSLSLHRFSTQVLILGTQRARTGSNIVHGCWLGLDGSGQRAGVGFQGLNITLTDGNEVGGSQPLERNVISGSIDSGIVVQGARSTRIQGNYIGTDPAGLKSIPNSAGIRLVPLTGSSVAVVGTVLGGLDPGQGNLISGNGWVGIYLSDSRSGQVLGNRIGTDVTGTRPLPNRSTGLLFESDCALSYLAISNLVQGNVIAANGSHGMSLDFCVRRNVVVGNWIGTDASGTATNLGNLGYGVVLELGARENSIGGPEPGQGNQIAFNGRGGVFLGAGPTQFQGALPSTRSLVRGNAIHDNQGLGIDIDFDPDASRGVLANDPLDVDSGPNFRQNYPTISRAESDGSQLNLQASLNSRPSQTFLVDFYLSPTCDPSGNGEGERWVGSTSVQTDADGNALMDVTLPASIPRGTVVTATATDSLGNTSEFSACAVVVEGAGRPALHIGREPDGSLTLTWPGVDTAFQLEYTPSLSPPQWRNVPATSGFRLSLPSDSSGFYRLHRP